MTTDRPNPATSTSAPSRAERKRIPMGVPVRKLEVPPIPGYVTLWIMNTPSEIQRALNGGCEFVDSNEIQLNNVSLGGDSAESGNTDMGSRVSVVAGKELGKDGQAERLVLMKLKEEWYQEDELLREEQSEKTASALRGGLIGSDKDRPGDTQFRYVDPKRTKIPDLFIRKRRKVV